MQVSIKIDGLENVMAKLNGALDIERALLLGGEVVRTEAQANCPKDTGRLSNSIVVQSEGRNSVVIGPTAGYGVYVEYGTGAKGDPSVPHTNKRGWVYYNEKTGQFVYTTGQAPQPFLVPALYSQKDAIIAAIRQGLLNGMEG